MKIIIWIFFILSPLISLASVKDSIVYSGSIGGMYLSGNINNTSITIDGDLSGYNKSHYWYVDPTYKYLINNLSPSNTAISKQNEFYSDQSYNYRSDKKLKMLLFSEVEHSQVRKINIRADVGYGIGYRISGKHTTLYLSEVALPDYYQSLQIKGAHYQMNNSSIRSSLRLKFVYKIDNFTFTSIEMYQPALYTIGYDDQLVSTYNNTNFRSTNKFDFKIKGGFSLGISADFLYQTYLQYIDNINNLKLSPSNLSVIFYIKFKGEL